MQETETKQFKMIAHDCNIYFFNERRSWKLREQNTSEHIQFDRLTTLHYIYLEFKIFNFKYFSALLNKKKITFIRYFLKRRMHKISIFITYIACIIYIFYDYFRKREQNKYNY